MCCGSHHALPTETLDDCGNSLIISGYPHFFKHFGCAFVDVLYDFFPT